MIGDGHILKNFDYYAEVLINFGIEYGIRIIGAIAIFFIGKWIARQVIHLISHTMEKANVDATLISFTNNLIYIALIIMVVVAAASNLGINTSSFLAIFGAAGLAIGLALKDTLSNVGAAVLIIFFRPFKVGDYIEVSGVQGTAKAINLFSTTLDTADNRSIIIPNGLLIASNIINYNSNTKRRIDLVFGIDYRDNLKLAKEVIVEVLMANKNILQDPAPVVAIGALTDNSVQVFVRPWVDVDMYWDTKFELIEQVKLAFDKNNISIPFPQMDLHVRKAERI
jgi:small conductance mechanosensitive channel